METEVEDRECLKHRVNAVAKLIWEAQTLDDDGNQLGAYRHYLMCVQAISQVLDGDIKYNGGKGTMSPPKVTKLFSMAKECLERAEAIYPTLQALALSREAAATPPRNIPPPGPNQHMQEQKQHHQQQHTSPGSHKQQEVASAAGVVHVAPPNQPHPPAHHTHQLQSPAPPTRTQSDPSHQSTQRISRLHRLSPMEEAQRKNQMLMTQYKAYLKRTSSKMLPAEVGLDYLRRLEENIGVARIREKAIANKLHERQIRVRQEAESASKQQPLQALSKEEICGQIACFDHGKSKVTAARSKVTHSGSGESDVYNFVNEVLSTTDHPLCKLLGEYQYSVLMKLRPLARDVEQCGPTALPTLELMLAQDSTGTAHQHTPTNAEAPPYHRGGSTRSTTVVSAPAELVPSPEERPGTNTSDELVFSEEEEEEEEDLFRSLSPHTQLKQTSSDEGTAASAGKEEKEEKEDDVLERKLALLRSALLSDTVKEGMEKRKEDGEGGGGGGGGSERERGEEIISPVDHIAVPVAVGDPRHTYSSNERLWNGDPQTSDHVAKSCGPAIQVSFDDEPDGAMFSRPEEFVMDVGCDLDGEESRADSYEELEEDVSFSSLPRLACVLHLDKKNGTLSRLVPTAKPVLEGVVRDMHSHIESLEDLFAAAYPELSTEERRDTCKTVLEANYFSPIMPMLTVVYRCVKYSEEVSTADNMCRHVNATPHDLSVRKKFWLNEQQHAPYGEVIDKVRGLPQLKCPGPKLDSLVEVFRDIILCIDNYNKLQGMHAQSPSSSDSAVGVDDILPILSYIIIRSARPELVAECAIMEEFIHENFLMGEEGFCLTSFNTALRFVANMSS